MGQNNALSLEEFIEQIQADYDQTQKDLREIDILVKQSSAEVDRAAQRNSQMTNYVNQLPIDTAPREDIKEGYDNLLNAQQRLFTMRGQLEKLQSDRKNLQRLNELQGTMMGVLEELGLISPSSDDGLAPRPMGDLSTIIRVIQSEEAARQSLVRKMHDGPASSLSNFILQAEICEKLFDSDPNQARVELQTLKTTAAGTFSKVKDFIFDLRPMMLDDLGVIPTLRSYINSYQDKSGIAASFVIAGIERRLESHVEVTIFRAVQELINNARFHGQATQVDVQIDIGSERVVVVVEDNGSGFNPEEILNNPNTKSIGLRTLQEKLSMLNGELNIRSGLGKGTHAQFTIPVTQSTLSY